MHQEHARNSRSSPRRQVQILSTHVGAHAQAAEDAPQLIGGSLGHGRLALLLLVLLVLERSRHQRRGDAPPIAVGVLEGWVPAAQWGCAFSARRCTGSGGAPCCPVKLMRVWGTAAVH